MDQKYVKKQNHFWNTFLSVLWWILGVVLEIFLGSWRVKTGSFFWRVFGRLLCRILGQLVVLLLLHWEVESVSWHNTTAVFTHFEKRWSSLVEACWATLGCHVSSFLRCFGGPEMDLKLT